MVKLRILLLSLMSLLLVIVSIWFAGWLLTPRLAQYCPQYAAWLSQKIGKPIQIESCIATWQFFSPKLTFRNVTVWDDSKINSLLKVTNVGIEIDILNSIWQGKIVLRRVTLTGSKLAVNQLADQSFSIEGFNNSAELRSRDAFFEWLFSEKLAIQINDVQVALHRLQGGIFSFYITKLALNNYGKQHVLRGHLKLLPTMVDFKLDFVGNYWDLQHSRAKIGIDAQQIDLPFWLAKYNYNGYVLHSGAGDIHVKARWAAQQWQAFKGDIALHHLQIRDDKKILGIEQLAGNVIWQSFGNNGWQLQGKHMDATIGGKRWPENHFKYVQARSGNVNTHVIQIGFLDIPAVQALWPLFPQKIQDLLNQLKPTGQLNPLNVYFDIDQNKNINSLAIDSDFTNLGFQAWGKIPGINNLSGQFHYEPGHGQLICNSKNVTLNFGRLFRYPLVLQNLQARLRWLKNSQGWIITGKQIAAQNDDLDVKGNVQLKLDANIEQTWVNLKTQATVKKTDNISHYLPVTILHKDLITWLDQAFPRAKSGHATVILQGLVDKFPYDNHDGVFKVDADFQDVDLHCWPQWPLVEHLTGDVHFAGRSMLANISKGNIFNASLSQVKANIPYLGKDKVALLDLKGVATGSLQDLQRFIKSSPVKTWVGQDVSQLQTSGNMQLALHLSLPLEVSQVPWHLDSLLAIDQGNIALKDWRLTQVQGTVALKDHLLQGKEISANLWDKPVQIAIQPITQGTQISLSGKFDVDQIAQHFAINVPKEINGHSNFQANITLQKNNASQLNLSSNLKGINIHLPPPIGKTASEAINLKVTSDLGESTPRTVQIQYGDKANAIMLWQLQSNIKDWQLTRGEIRFDNTLAVLPTTTGLVLAGHLPELSWDILRPWFAAGLPSTLDNSLLKQIDLTLDKAEVWGQQLTTLKMQATHGNGYWEINLNSPTVQGTVQIPIKTGVIIAQLNRLYLASLLGSNQKALSPTDIPALDLNCRDFHYADKNFGTVQLKLSKRQGALVIDQLQSTTPVSFLAASGLWELKPNGTLTSLSGKLQSRDFSATLASWGLPPRLKSNHAQVSFVLNWQAAPYDLHLPLLNGHIQLQFGQGEVSNIKGTGSVEMALGRLLTLLSLQTVTRRLQLDFSDLSTQGYSFDTLQGDINLEHGMATTNNLSLDGPVAEIALNGDINLLNEEHNLWVKVTPHVTASLPVIAALTGGPVAGAVTWVVNKMLGTQLQKLTSHTYRVTGTWSKPNIREIMPAGGH